MKNKKKIKQLNVKSKESRSATEGLDDINEVASS